MKIEIIINGAGPVTVNIAPEPPGRDVEITLDGALPTGDRVAEDLDERMAEAIRRDAAPEPTYTLDVELRDGGVHYSCGIEHVAVNAKIHAIVSEDVKKLIADDLTTGARVVQLLDKHRDEITALGITEASIWDGKKTVDVMGGTTSGILAGVWAAAIDAEFSE